jgi:molecular chaperone DnaK (HSP70)
MIQAVPVENVTIIGFDLGHGETALASTRLATTEEPRPVTVNGAKTIPTIVGRLPDGRILFGETAGRTAAELVESYERFKSPDLTDAAGGPSRAARATQMFVGAIIAALQADRQIGDLNATHLFVGHPSGWSARSVDDYRSLLMRTGLPLVDVVPESRAAFIHARESGELNLSMDELAEKVLIMDFGSSTTDFTATLGLATQPLDFGHVSLGAGIIDGLIMERMVSRSGLGRALTEALERLPGKRTELAYKCRMAKERYFNVEKTVAEPLIEDIVRIDTGLSVDIELDRAAMEAVLAEPNARLDGMNWRQALADCLTKARQQVGAPDLIILTGGATRMGFVRDGVAAMFPQTKIAVSQEPELAIAKGLALYGRLLLKTQSFRNEIDKLVISEGFRTVIADALPDLTERQAASVATGLAEGPVRAAIRRWREEPDAIRTIDDLGSQIATSCKDWVRSAEAQTVMTTAAADWLESIRIRLEMMTDPFCERFGIPKRALSLRGQTLISASGGQIGAPDVIGDVSVVQAVASVIASVVAAKLLLAVGVLLGSHPIGWATAVIGSIAAAIIGVEEAKKLLNGVAIPGFLRGMLISEGKIDKLVAEAGRTIAAQLRQELERNDSAAPEGDKLANKLCEQVGLAIRHRADDALLLVR